MTNTPRSLLALMREASGAARWRGHRMAPWTRRDTTASTHCRRCPAAMAVDTAPAPFDIDIGGTAVALNCPMVEAEAIR